MKPFVWYMFAGVSWLNAISAIVLFWIFGPSPNRPPDMLLSWVLVGWLAKYAGDLERKMIREKSELTQRLADQDERIRKLEAQLAALTEPTPTH